MTRVLLLGGTGEALQLARRLGRVHELTYSLAGRVRVPDLPVAVHVGGFGGVAGLVSFVSNGRYELLLDVTHPYAIQISMHAALAAKQTGTPLWGYRRPRWQPCERDDWRTISSWAELEAALKTFRRPFFTVGLEPLRWVEAIPQWQHWVVRSAVKAVPVMLSRLTMISSIGPFNLDQELALMRAHEVDVVIAKNSGGSAVAAKLEAARILRIPVIMLAQPTLPAVDREFMDIDNLAKCLGS